MRHSIKRKKKTLQNALVIGVLVTTVFLLTSVAAGEDIKDILNSQSGEHTTAINYVLISGSPLQIYVGDDNSFQILNDAVPGNGQIYPSSQYAPADMGAFVRIQFPLSGILFCPNFGDHGISAANSILTNELGTYSTWTAVSLSAVTGSGSTADPYTVTVVTEASTYLRLTMTVQYINGEDYFTHDLEFENISGVDDVCFDAYFGSDIYLASSDYGIPYKVPTGVSVGGQSCPSQDYSILHIPISPSVAERYTAAYWANVWEQMAWGHLDNTVHPATCSPSGIDNGAALEYTDRCPGPDQTLTLMLATSFGDIPDIAVGEAVFDPDPAHMYYMFAYTPIIANVYVGNFTDPYTAADVASAAVNGIPATIIGVVSHPDFVDDVVQLEIPIAPFLEPYGAPMDTSTHSFAVTGLFGDSQPFDGSGAVDLIGKYSNNPKRWILPPGDVLLHGDVNVSGYLDIDDVVYMIDFIFTGGIIFGPMAIADCDCSNEADVDDVVYLIAFIFTGGPFPCHQ